MSLQHSSRGTGPLLLSSRVTAMRGFNPSSHSKTCYTGGKYRGVGHHWLIVCWKVCAGSRVAVSSEAHRP